MNAAVINKKTIVLWEKLSQSEADELLDELVTVIKKYQYYTKDLKTDGDFAVPITLKRSKNNQESSSYLTVLKKNGVFVLSTTRDKENFTFSPVLNGDSLYQSLNILKRDASFEIEERSSLFQKTNGKWVAPKFSEAVLLFLLSPNPNPEDFIESLKKNDLPRMYKQFLEDAGIVFKENRQREISVPEDEYEK